MENKLTLKKNIGLIFMVLINLGGVSLAQVTHDVTVLSNQFNPSTLAIAVGDIVKWTNTEGTHNVDGNQTTYPTNPESFGNTSGGPGWTYSFTFNVQGVYNYRCSVHGASMSGKITVGNVTGIHDNTSDLSSKKAYPNPASDILYIPLSEKIIKQTGNLKLNIYTLNGKCFTREVSVYNELLPININELNNGIYFFKLSNADNIISSGKFVKNQ